MTWCRDMPSLRESDKPKGLTCWAAEPLADAMHLARSHWRHSKLRSQQSQHKFNSALAQARPHCYRPAKSQWPQMNEFSPTLAPWPPCDLKRSNAAKLRGRFESSDATSALGASWSFCDVTTVGLKCQLYVVPYVWSKKAGKQSSEWRMTFTWWRVVWAFTSHKNTLNEGWCGTWHHITMHSMKGGVRLDIT